MSARTARIAAILAGLAGLTAFVLLIAYHNLAELGELLARAGWGIGAVILIHIPQLFLCALAWRAAASPLWPRGTAVFLWARLVRESVSTVLPFTLVGGDFVGARVLTFHGARAVVAGGSVLVDLTFEFITQIVFTAIGLLALLTISGSGAETRWIELGLALAVPAAVGAVLVQRWGVFRMVERFLEKLALRLGWPALRALDGLHETVAALYRNPRAVAVGTASHLGAWLFGAIEVWLILHFLGVDIGIGQALIIESLGQAIRSAAFFVPSALGVQEGGFLLIGTMFGLAPEVGLAISLIKRIREVVLGVPALLVWQAIEGRRFLSRTRDS
ncbi:MAG TPA: lysylphosphatidylglycerol synthase domain-containing protein [Alphaproteobacteria bacterium]|nr:lysylphosphatidylglycerol synthase domain-containing protein [Alphaproteobacteria bacterium]